MKFLRKAIVSIGYGSLALVMLTGVAPVIPTSVFVDITDFDVNDERYIRVAPDVSFPTKAILNISVYRNLFEIQRCAVEENIVVELSTLIIPTQLSCDLQPRVEYKVEACLSALGPWGLKMRSTCRSEEFNIRENILRGVDDKIEELQLQLDQVQRMVVNP